MKRFANSRDIQTVKMMQRAGLGEDWNVGKEVYNYDKAAFDREVRNKALNHLEEKGGDEEGAPEDEEDEFDYGGIFPDAGSDVGSDASEADVDEDGNDVGEDNGDYYDDDDGDRDLEDGDDDYE